MLTHFIAEYNQQRFYIIAEDSDTNKIMSDNFKFLNYTDEIEKDELNQFKLTEINLNDNSNDEIAEYFPLYNDAFNYIKVTDTDYLCVLDNTILCLIRKHITSEDRSFYSIMS